MCLNLISCFLYIAGDTSQEHSTTGPADQNQSTITSPLLSSPDIGHPEGTLGDANLIKNVTPTSYVNHGRETMNSTISSNGVQSVVQDFIDFSEKEQSLTGKLRTDNREKNKTSVDTTSTSMFEILRLHNYYFFHIGCFERKIQQNHTHT